MQRVDPQLLFVEPMECHEVRDVSLLPRGEDWQYEIKFDGYRCIGIKQRSEAELFSRRGHTFNQFPNLNTELQEQHPKRFIIDGEVVALDAEGRSDFNGLQNAKNTPIEAHFYAFDLIHLEGKDLKGKTLEQRQAILADNFASTTFFHTPGPLRGALKVILAKIRQFGFEGIIAKNRRSLYVPGARSGTWVKKKLKQSDEFFIGGYIPHGNAVDELVIGKYFGRDLVFVESTDDGFVPATRREVFERIAKLETPKCPFVNLPEKRGRRNAMDRDKMAKVHWVKPRVKAEIEFNEWTPNKHLRHSEFKRLRD